MVDTVKVAADVVSNANEYAQIIGQVVTAACTLLTAIYVFIKKVRGK